MRKRLWVVVACLMMLAVVVTPVSARTDWTSFSGTFTKVGDLPGGSEWLSKDFSMMFCRNLREIYVVDVDDARLDGNSIFTFSGNLHLAAPPVYVYGPLYGSMSITNDGGSWEGRWTGSRTEQGYNYQFAVLHGHGGYEGMLAHVYFVRETTGLYDAAFIHGYVK